MSVSSEPQNSGALCFGGPEAAADPATDADVVVLPVPFERTVSYGRGTVDGPAALLRASGYVELYDEELDCEPCAGGVLTAPPFTPEAGDLEGAIREIEAEARRYLATGKFLVTLGGEHSLSYGPVAAARALVPELGVVQFDAHADLREEYEGTPWSHACVMRRILDLDVSTLAIGIRALSTPEARLIRERRLPVVWGHELDAVEERFDALLDTLPESVYLTFDVDYFDPSLVPATGTPEPGGGAWYPTLRLLRRLFARKRVVAMDVVELAPFDGQPASDFTAAKLVMKALGYRRVGLRP